MNTEGTEIAPSNIVINGQEYTPEDAQSLIELGSKTRDLEKQWNTPVDKVWPEYGKLSQERTQWQSEKARLEGQLSTFQNKQQQGVETPADVTQAREAARKLGLTLNEDLEKQGYIKKDQLDEYYSQKEQEKSAVQQVLDTADKLAKEIDGTDGRPKFHKKAVIAYANAYGFSDLNEAYEDMHSEQIKSWKEEQIAKSKAAGLKTLKSSGVKQPGENRPKSDEDARAQLKETLWGSEQGK